MSHVIVHAYIDYNRKLVKQQRRYLFKNFNHEDISIDVRYVLNQARLLK
jgi:hypothetical protein